MENDQEKYHKQKETSNWKVMEWNQVLSEKLSKTRKTCVAFYLMSKSILDIYMHFSAHLILDPCFLSLLILLKSKLYWYSWTITTSIAWKSIWQLLQKM